MMSQRPLVYIFIGAIRVLRKTMAGERGCQMSSRNHYECVRFNVISDTRGWDGAKFKKKTSHKT